MEQLMKTYAILPSYFQLNRGIKKIKNVMLADTEI